MRLFDKGKLEEAAEAFDSLAKAAEERGKLFQAANLTAQAARCYFRLDDIDQAYDKGKGALDLFKRADRPGAAKKLGERMVKILRKKGREAEAETLARELKQLPPLSGLASREASCRVNAHSAAGPLGRVKRPGSDLHPRSVPIVAR